MNNFKETDNKILFLEFSENQKSFDYENELSHYTFGRIHILSDEFQTFLLDNDMGIFMIYKFKGDYHLHCLTKHIYLFEKIKDKYPKNSPGIIIPGVQRNLLNELIELNKIRYHTGNQQAKEESKKMLNYIYGEHSKLQFKDRFLSYTLSIPPISIETNFQDIIKLGYWLSEEMSKINELRLQPGISITFLQDWIYYTLYPNLNFLDKRYTSTPEGLTPLELKKEMQIVSIPNKFNE